MQAFYSYMQQLNLVSIVVRLLMAMGIGGLLGMERGRKNRPAGFRTYILVCLGSALVMMTNQYVFNAFDTSDPVRMGAQVISGIGFLGAGTIIVTGRNQVKGITTAAGLWTAACCGLAIGIGFYEGAIAGGIAIFLVMSVLRKLDERIRRHSKTMGVYIEFDGKTTLGQFIEYARSKDIELTELQLSKQKLEKETTFCVLAEMHSPVLQREAMQIVLEEASGIKYWEEIT
ncbi:MAG: MgtC/SapB family protein [Oscillospiraceae bacterium]